MTEQKTLLGEQIISRPTILEMINDSTSSDVIYLPFIYLLSINSNVATVSDEILSKKAVYAYYYLFG